LVNKETKFTTVLYCHNFGSFDVIGHVTIRPSVGGFLCCRYVTKYRDKVC